MVDYVVKLTKDATKVLERRHRRTAGRRIRRPRHPADHADRLLVQLHQPRGRCAGRGARVESRLNSHVRCSRAQAGS